MIVLYRRYIYFLGIAFFFVGVIFFSVPAVAFAASDGADGSGTGGDEGTPTTNNTGFSASTSWSSATSSTWTVPSGVERVKVRVWGAGGGGAWLATYGGSGGGGGYVEGVISVISGQVLTVEVGAGGANSATADTSAGGGGLTRVASGTTNWFIAGSGGGGGNGGNPAVDGGDGGAGGGTTGWGGGGGAAGGVNGGDGGSAGTQSAGGAAGANYNGASAGTSLSGGSGGTSAPASDGGDGGAGYYGGGGGGSSNDQDDTGGGGGGGGSSYVISSASATSTDSGTDATAAQNSIIDYADNAGNGGGPETDGNDGRVVIWYTPDTTAPSPSPLSFTTAPDGVSISSIDMTSLTATDASSTVSYYFETVTGSCGANLGTGGTDSSWQSSTSYTDTGLQTNKCYAYTVTARDAADNYGATSTASSTYTTAATPGLVTFSSVLSASFVVTNDANGNPSSNPATNFAVQVSATSPSDATWDTMYVDASGDPSASAVWLTDAQLDNLTFNDLNGETQYTLRAKARNQDGDETAWSTTAATTTTLTSDAAPPTPDPLTFSSAPDGASVSSVSMTATTATDDNDIEYYFEAVTGSCGANLGTGGTDSGWQSSTSYTDTGLDENKCYAYEVTARDAAGNYTATSSVASAYTAAATPGTPAFIAIEPTTVRVLNDANGNPASNPTTYFAVQVSATSPTDATWDTMYVDASGDPSASAVWLTDAQIDALYVAGLTPETSYTFQVKARNEDSDETPFGPTNNTTADPLPPSNMRFRDGVRLQSGVRL